MDDIVLIYFNQPVKHHPYSMHNNRKVLICHLYTYKSMLA